MSQEVWLPIATALGGAFIGGLISCLVTILNYKFNKKMLFTQKEIDSLINDCEYFKKEFLKELKLIKIKISDYSFYICKWDANTNSVIYENKIKEFNNLISSYFFESVNEYINNLEMSYYKNISIKSKRNSKINIFYCEKEKKFIKLIDENFDISWIYLNLDLSKYEGFQKIQEFFLIINEKINYIKKNTKSVIDDSYNWTFIYAPNKKYYKCPRCIKCKILSLESKNPLVKS